MIKTSELYAKVIEVAEKNPDVVYRDRAIELSGVDPGDCEYALNGKPACLVGVALFELGLDIETLKDFDDSYGVIAEVIDAEQGTIFEVDSPIEDISVIQSAQDMGTSWGDSIKFLDAKERN